jgi:hypothetical protein
MHSPLKANIADSMKVNGGMNFRQSLMRRDPTRNRAQNLGITPVSVTEPRRVHKSEVLLLVVKIVRRKCLGF